MSSDTMDGKHKVIAYESLSRREIRSLIFHLIYAMEGFDHTVSLATIANSFNRGFSFAIPLDSEVVLTAQSIIDARVSLDSILTPLLANWRLERVGLCTKLILRMAIFELQQKDTPSSIVINEAIELAKCFSEKDAYRFVNGVLDEFCKAKKIK